MHDSKQGNMVLRTIYLDPAIDDALRDEHARTGVSPDELIRRYLDLGLAVEAAKKAQERVEKLAHAMKRGVRREPRSKVPRKSA